MTSCSKSGPRNLALTIQVGPQRARAIASKALEWLLDPASNFISLSFSCCSSQQILVVYRCHTEKIEVRAETVSLRQLGPNRSRIEFSGFKEMPKTSTRQTHTSYNQARIANFILVSIASTLGSRIAHFVR